MTEIEYWKKNRLLPAAYCDFLVNLYSEGQSSDGAERHARKLKRRFLSLAAILVLLAAGGIWAWPHITSWGRLAAVLIAAAVLAAAGLRQKRAPRMRFVFSCLSSMLVLVAGWLEYPNAAQWPEGPVFVFAAVFAAWLVLGSASRSRWIAATAWSGLLGLTGLREFHQFPLTMSSYGFQHIIWLIPSAAALACTRAMSAYHNPVAAVSALFSILPLFVPDGIVLGSSSGSLVVYIILFLKLATGIALFVVYRNQIRGWWTATSRHGGWQAGQGM